MYIYVYNDRKKFRNGQISWKIMIMEKNVQYNFSISSDLLYGYIEMTFM